MLNALPNTVGAMTRDEFNPHGVGHMVKETPIQTSGGYDLYIDANRTFRITNSAVRNPVNEKAVAYKIQAPPFQKILADKESFHAKRTKFADHNIYITKYHDNELSAGGKYTYESWGGTGVLSWANIKEDVKDTDVVV